jgi:hypothetical protein
MQTWRVTLYYLGRDWQIPVTMYEYLVLDTIPIKLKLHLLQITVVEVAESSYS